MKNEKGFLLLELLVVLALLALLAPPLTGLLFVGWEGLLLAGRRTVAANLAVEGLEVACSRHFCEINSTEETEVDGFTGYVRTVEVREIPATAGTLPLKAVSVTVSWQQGARRQSVLLLAWQAWR